MSYNVTIRESSFELSKRDTLRYKEVSNSVPLDEVTKDGEFIITNPTAYVILDIHNPKAKDNADYSKIIVIDPREFNQSGKPSLDLAALAASQGVDDLLVINYPFMISSGTYVSYLNRLVGITE